MKEIFPSNESDADWREKYFTAQKDLRDKQQAWQHIEQISSLLISHLARLVECEDTRLLTNLILLRKSLREGESLSRLEALIKDITEQILACELKSPVAKHTAVTGRHAVYTNEQITVLSDILCVLLERINFPAQYAAGVKDIKKQLSQSGQTDDYHKLLAAISALTELLADIFDTVRHDKQKIEHYLQHLSTELQQLDKGIVSSGILHNEKQQAEEHIQRKVETAVQDMENTMTTLVDINEFKVTVQRSMDAIRSHLTDFQSQEQQRNLQAETIVAQLGQKLKAMEQECEGLKQQVLKKHQQTMSDPLTGLRNRLAYEEAIQQELERFQRYGRAVALIVFDLDKFKSVNDTYGHSVGDKVLQSIARILARNIRSVDFLARYGGEEFVVILPELGLTEAKSVAQKIVNAVEAGQIGIDGNVIHMTISGGLALVQPHDSAESLFERADAALYLAKERGRNRCEAE